MFEKVLIANRGEIAVRVARACMELGIRTVAVYSEADEGSTVLRLADETVCIGPPASRRSYQNPAAIIEAALQTGADAIHPGYGFLSEDPDFAEICAAEGVVFIGPPPEVMSVLGDKASARAVMRKAGLPLLSGTVETLSSVADAKEVADEVGYPVIVKAAAGGGGRGMTIVREASELASAFTQTRITAQTVFGDPRVYVERYLEQARHVEVQFLCDEHGTGVHLGTRDCSVQRRHQKLVEEGPAPNLAAETLAEMGAVTVAAALDIGYTGAGTAEFLVDGAGRYYFMEINSRIQVEHTVSEAITGVDLVREQLRVAAGLPLGFTQDDIDVRGVAVECRVNAEDPARGFRPTAGPLHTFLPPGGPFTRVDTHAYPGWQISPHYDSLLAKVVVWAPDRATAVDRMDRALREFEITGAGVETTIPFLRRVLADPEFRAAGHSTDLVERLLTPTIDSETDAPDNRRTS